MKSQRLLTFYINLTPRQRDVVRSASRGLTNREIADELCISPHVVAEHLTNIYAALPDVSEEQSQTTNKRYQLILLFGHFFEEQGLD